MKYRLKVKQDNGTLETVDLALSQADQIKLDNAASEEYVQTHIASLPPGPMGPIGPQGPPGISSSTNTFFNLYVDEKGDLYAAYPDEAAQNNFELTDNKDLYFISDPSRPDVKFFLGNLMPPLSQTVGGGENEVMSAKATTDALKTKQEKMDALPTQTIQNLFK